MPYLLLAALALGSGGCLAAAIGGVAAGAVVGYTYVRGAVGAEFPADFNTAWSATNAALAELGMPVVEPTRTSDITGKLVTQTGDGTKVTISLETRSSKIPAEGPITAIHIRVGLVGDRAVGERIMAQIQLRLEQGVPPPPVPAGVTPVPVAGAPLPQTAPPPLAPAAQASWQRPAAN
jgi:hypothetical protein